MIGEESFNLLLRRMIYPDPALEKFTDGRQVRFVATSDFLYLAESISGQKLEWFFEIYLPQPELPVLVFSRESNILNIHWEVPETILFLGRFQKQTSSSKRLKINGLLSHSMKKDV